MPRGVPRVVAPPRRRPVFSWARRPPRASSPPARVVSPRARRRRRARRPPPRASSPSLIVADGNAERQPQKRCKRREGNDDTRGGGNVDGHDARVGKMRGATRVGRRRGAQPHTQCAPPSSPRPSPCAHSSQLNGLQSVDSQSECPQQEPPFKFCPNVQDFQLITGGFSTFRRESRESKIPIQFMA